MAVASGGLIPGYHKGGEYDLPHKHEGASEQNPTGRIRWDVPGIIEMEEARLGPQERPWGTSTFEGSPMEGLQEFPPLVEGVLPGMSSEDMESYWDYWAKKREAAEAAEEDYVAPRPGTPGHPGQQRITQRSSEESGFGELPVSARDLHIKEIDEARRRGDDVGVESGLDAFNKLMGEIGHGERADGVDGGYNPQSWATKAAEEIEDTRDLLRAYTPEQQRADRIKRRINRREYEQARGIKSLDDTEIARREALLDRRLGAGSDRLEEMRRLERLRSEKAPDRFKGSFMTKMADIATDMDGKWSDLSDEAEAMGDKLRLEEDTALEGIYDQLVGDIGVEDLERKGIFSATKKAEQDWDTAENSLDNFEATLLEAADTRGKEGAVETMKAFVDLFMLQGREAGLDRRVMDQMENAMNVARLQSENQAMDVTMHEPIMDYVADWRKHYAGNDEMQAKITQFENFMYTARGESLWNQAAGSMQPMTSVQETRVPQSTPRRNMDPSGRPLPPTIP